MGWERSLLNKKFREEAIDQIKDVGATVVWWDPLISFLPSNVSENNNVGMRAVLDHLTKINRECKCSSIVIHHFSQPASNAKDEVPLRYRLRGASSIRDWADTIAVVQATGKSENPGPGRKLTFTKIRNGPRRLPIFLERDRNFVHHRTDDKRKATAITVIEVIKAHGDEGRYQGSQNELCSLIEEAAGCSKPVAVRAIKEAVEAHQIEEKLVDAVKYWTVIEQGW
jgi:RecA-family ATPase